MGEVICGNIGSSVRCEYAVLGRFVNLAARLMCYESENKKIKIICSDRIVQGDSANEYLMEKELVAKGFSSDIKIFGLAEIYDGDLDTFLDSKQKSFIREREVIKAINLVLDCNFSLKTDSDELMLKMSEEKFWDHKSFIRNRLGVFYGPPGSGLSTTLSVAKERFSNAVESQKVILLEDDKSGFQALEFFSIWRSFLIQLSESFRNMLDVKGDCFSIFQNYVLNTIPHKVESLPLLQKLLPKSMKKTKSSDLQSVINDSDENSQDDVDKKSVSDTSDVIIDLLESVVKKLSRVIVIFIENLPSLDFASLSVFNKIHQRQVEGIFVFGTSKIELYSFLALSVLPPLLLFLLLLQYCLTNVTNITTNTTTNITINN